jgi:hypothetical protein
MSLTPVVPAFVGVGGIFIDDIVYPDGRTSMGILGGGGVHACAGMTIWDERPGLAAAMGAGMPPALLARLHRDFDMQGVIEVPYPQVRAWQLFEWDGKRTEVFRVEVIAPFMDEPGGDLLPATYRTAQAACVLRSGAYFHQFKRVFSPDTVLLWEPEQAYMIPDNRAEFTDTLPHTDIVSPNLLESSLLYEMKAGLDEPDRLVDRMLDDGAKIVALRMGDLGSLVASAAERILIPPVPVPTIVDQTGAGNTYCGGFLVGWMRTRDLRQAGYYGAVAASFALESVGVLRAHDADIRDQRLAWLRTQSG